MMPDGHDADAFRKVVLENFDMSLGTGLNKLKGKAFRIGHLGHTNELMLMGALAGVEMGLDLAGVPHARAALPRRWTCSRDVTLRRCQRPPLPELEASIVGAGCNTAP